MKHLRLKFAGIAALLAVFAMPIAQAGDAGTAQTAYTVTAPGNTELKALASKLEADSALAEAACIPLTAESSKTLSASYSCAKPSEKTDAAFRGALGVGSSLSTVTASCPTGCVMTFCPYPVSQCCNIYTHMPCQ